MFYRRKYLFSHKKTTYKKLLFVCTTLLCLLGTYLFIHTYLQHKINLLLADQQKKIKEQDLTFKFQPLTKPSWKIWPQIRVAYPAIQKKSSSSLPQTVWQAKQANISYSLWHPLSISIKLDGEQLFCPNENIVNCFQIHGSAWSVLVPFWGDYTSNSIYFNCAETFYTNTSQSKWDIKSLQLKNIQADIHWNKFAGQKDSLAFSNLNIKQIFINFAALPPQNLNNIQIKSALIKEKNTSDLSRNLYRLLIQKADFSWDNLFVSSNGKLYLPIPQVTPTGEILLHLDGIDQIIYQQLASLNCCIKLKKELSQTSLPSQINFTLFIREGVIYLGAIPLQTIWYDHFKTLINTYTK